MKNMIAQFEGAYINENISKRSFLCSMKEKDFKCLVKISQHSVGILQFMVKLAMHGGHYNESSV